MSNHLLLQSVPRPFDVGVDADFSNKFCHISTFSGVFGAPQLIPRAVPLWRIALWKVPLDNGERSWNIAPLASFWLHVDEESWQERHLQRDTAAASRLSEDGHPVFIFFISLSFTPCLYFIFHSIIFHTLSLTFILSSFTSCLHNCHAHLLYILNIVIVDND